MWPRALLTVALRGPGKGLLLASAGGWIIMAWLFTRDRLPHAALPLGHGAHAVASTSKFDLSDHFLAVWVAMILAMAPPLLVREIGRLWRTSLRRLRHFTIVWFLCGYVAVWLIAGVGLSSVFGSVTVKSWRIDIGIILIGIWQCSPARQRCLNACHRTPTLRIFGIAAQLDSLQYGIAIGCYCSAACGPVMLLVLLAADYHLVVMAIAVVLATGERYSPARRPDWRLPLFRSRSIDWSGYAYRDVQSVRCAR
jgi:predicted metal-binding membrane protein